MNAAKSLAAETIVLATVAPSAAAIERARAAADAHLEATKAAAEALRSAGGGNRQADARSALSDAQSDRAASQRRLNDLQEALGGSPGPGGSAGSGGNAESRVRSLLADLGARTLMHLELGYTFRSSGGSTELTNAHPCSESEGACNIGSIRHDAERFFNPAFFPARRATASLSAAPANGVEAFWYMDSEEDGYGRLLAMGRHSAARLHLGGAYHYGVALGERHDGRPSDPRGGTATWRGQMVGRSMDGGSPLAGESALTYSIGTNTADVRISNIRAAGDVAPYTGSISFTWSGLAVNSDGSFHISGYNNDRSGVIVGTALHPTLGYIDGDFYGPNAEEAAGIFTRGNVNGTWLAKK